MLENGSEVDGSNAGDLHDKPLKEDSGRTLGKRFRENYTAVEQVGKGLCGP